MNIYLAASSQIEICKHYKKLELKNLLESFYLFKDTNDQDLSKLKMLEEDSNEK